MINKKNQLGKTPLELGVKDAIHVAIASVRAAKSIKPGSKVGINEHGEAISSNKEVVGIADPFLKSLINRGENFWLLLNQDAVPNVRHVWDHPKFSFEPPTRDIEYNKWILDVAEQAGVTYAELMSAAKLMVEKGKQTFNPKDCEDIEWYDFWSEWSDETQHEFENYGSECCPEYEYPGNPFT